MVVSTILLTALAPITGALFGASYGTSIRIGYEIIFPALFGDLLKEQNKRLASGSPQQADAKLTIQALHKMFTATGGVSAMEFGISQGIEMAKKKTESPEVQRLINLNLGITEEQLRRRHSTGTETKAQKQQRELEESAQIPGFAQPSGGESASSRRDYKQMVKNYPDNPIGNSRLNKNFNNPNYFGELNKSQRIAITKLYNERKKLGKFKHRTTQQAIDETSTGIVKQIATLFNELSNHLQKWNRTKVGRHAKNFINTAKMYNKLVQRSGKRNLTVDTAKSIQTRRIVKRF